MRNDLDKFDMIDEDTFKLMLRITIGIILTMIVITFVFMFRGCESELQPVRFEEQYTPTKFNKI